MLKRISQAKGLDSRRRLRRGIAWPLREAPRCIEGGLVGKFVRRWLEKRGGFGARRDQKVIGYHAGGRTAGVEDGDRNGNKVKGVMGGGHQI